MIGVLCLTPTTSKRRSVTVAAEKKCSCLSRGRMRCGGLAELVQARSLYRNLPPAPNLSNMLKLEIRERGPPTLPPTSRDKTCEFANVRNYPCLLGLLYARLHPRPSPRPDTVWSPKWPKWLPYPQNAGGSCSFAGTCELASGKARGGPGPLHS